MIHNMLTLKKKNPSTGEQTNKMQNMHIVEYYEAMKKRDYQYMLPDRWGFPGGSDGKESHRPYRSTQMNMKTISKAKDTKSCIIPLR